MTPMRQTSTMAKRGTNLRDNPQFLSPEYATYAQNVYTNADGKLFKRQGLLKLVDLATSQPILWNDIYDENTLIYAYDKYVAAYDIASNTSTIIKTFATASGSYSGDIYGSYYFITNGVTSMERITRTLAYVTQTSNFTVGATLTGATSGATATIIADADAGATGTLTIGYIKPGPTGLYFQAGEIITDSATGSATTGGIAGWATTTVTAAPVGKVIRAIANRLYIGQLQTDSSAVAYSAVDDGTVPPFTNWTADTLAAGPGNIRFRAAGQVNCISEFGQNIVVVFGDYGKWAFYLDTISNNNQLTRVERVVMQKIDGGAKACLFTDEGLFFVNQYGLWKLISLGQLQTPFSEQEQNDSQLLGTNYFQNVNLTRASISYNQNLRLILVSCGQSSAANNHVICYSLPFQAFSFFKGWTINSIVGINGKYYAGSANVSKIYQIFQNYDDDGNDIFVRFEQEIKLGGLESRQEIQKMFIQGDLSSSSQVYVHFDIYNRLGQFVKDKTIWLWTPQYAPPGLDGFSNAGYGESSWGGDVEQSGLIPSFSGCAVRIQNFQRIIIRIEETSKLQLAINWFTLIGRIKAENRRRDIVKVS